MLLAFAAALLAINTATIAAFASDKRRAIAGQWRIRESTLLGLAAIGGSPGAVWARQRFRHKTRKQPFASVLDVIVTVHTGILLGLLIAFWR